MPTSNIQFFKILFIITRKNIKHVEINLQKIYKTLMEKLFSNITKDIKEDLNKWRNKPTSRTSRFTIKKEVFFLKQINKLKFQAKFRIGVLLNLASGSKTYMEEQWDKYSKGNSEEKKGRFTLPAIKTY